MSSEFVHLAPLPRSEPPSFVSGRSPIDPRAPRTGPHSGRSRRRGSRRAPLDTSIRAGERAATARHFADRSLRLALEVVDRRRDPKSLRPILAPAVLGMLGALSVGSVPGRALGTAVVRTVHVQLVDTGREMDLPSGAEVFGTYSRGDRVFAVAARLTSDRRPGPTPGWTMTGLRLS